LDISALHPEILNLFLVRNLPRSGVCFFSVRKRKEKKRSKRKTPFKKLPQLEKKAMRKEEKKKKHRLRQ